MRLLLAVLETFMGMISCRILALEKLGAVFNQVSTPLQYTPRKFVIHPESSNLIIIETDHNAYTEETKDLRKKQMAKVLFQIMLIHSTIGCMCSLSVFVTAFMATGPRCWNSLSTVIRFMDFFRSILKSHLFYSIYLSFC